MGRVKLVFEGTNQFRKNVGMLHILMGLLVAAISVGYGLTFGLKALTVLAGLTGISMILVGAVFVKEE